MNLFLTDQADLFQGLKGGRLPLEMLKLPPIHVPQFRGIIITSR